jgi:hypothetical protein
MPNNAKKKNPLARHSRATREKTKGSFGKERRSSGRPAGSKNFITREVKEGIIAAYNKIGSDGEGKDGLEGYLEFLGREFIVFWALQRDRVCRASSCGSHEASNNELACKLGG